MKNVLVLAFAIAAISVKLNATTLPSNSQGNVVMIAVSTNDLPDADPDSPKVPPVI